MGIHFFLLIFLAQTPEGAVERSFAELARTVDPLARRTLATAFLNQYPDSWLLPQAYEAAARASFELNDYPTGVFYARQSLRIYPENPLLTGTLAAVLRNRGDLAGARQQARDTLRYLEIFQAPAGVKARDWQQVRARLLDTVEQVLGHPLPPPVAKPAVPRKADYAGSASCQPCHKAETLAWKETGMARMLQAANSDTIIGDFATLGQFQDGAFNPARGLLDKGRHFIELLRPNGMFARYAIDAVVGSKWQQAYATRAPNGELHVLPVQYNRLNQQWVNYWRIIDPPGSERARIAAFHQFRDLTAYQPNCAPCHTSQWTAKASLEPGINCEMCHGPSAAHAKGATAEFSFKRATVEESVAVCAQCHAQSAQRTPQGFPPVYLRRPYSEFDRKAFYRDGRFRETTFLVEAFERTACYREGKASCVSCHDPHPKAGAVNEKSLRYPADSDQMCLQCHPASFGEKGHTRHENTRCADCHMPKIMNALLFKAGTHQIDDIPRADPLLRFGREESPNACLSCHSAKSNEWVKKELAAWH